MSNRDRTSKLASNSSFAAFLLASSVAATCAWAADPVQIVTLQPSDVAGKALTPLGIGGEGRYLNVTAGHGRGFVEVPRYSSADGLLKICVKKFEEMTLALKDWPIDELIYLVSGRVEITDTAGQTRAYGPGEAIVIPRGFSGEWKQLSSVEMYTVEYGKWE